MKQLTDRDRDINLAVGFVREWIKNEPSQVKQNFDLIADGLRDYWTSWVDSQQDFDNLQSKYNELVATSARYLAEIQNLKQENDQLLAETQRPFHKLEGADEVGS